MNSERSDLNPLSALRRQLPLALAALVIFSLAFAVTSFSTSTAAQQQAVRTRVETTLIALQPNSRLHCSSGMTTWHSQGPSWGEVVQAGGPAVLVDIAFSTT